MAGDWIKIEHGLLGKPEVMLLAETLNASTYEVVGHLVAFWLWADTNLSPDCPQVKGTKKGLDGVAGRDGFCDAMISVGWMQVEDGMVSIPGYDVHLSKSAKERAKGQKKKAMQRIKLSLDKGDKQGDKLGTQWGTREEKRREELNHTHTPAPAWLEKEWKRWCDFREAIDGRPMDAVSSEAILMNLIRRGDGKAQRDIDFSIQKRAKSICDSDNDWAKQRANTPTGSGRRYGKETAEEARLRKEAENPPDPEIAAKIKRLQEEMWNGNK
jgi:hypothetical protein